MANTTHDDATEQASLATPPMPSARITLIELVSSFYLWLIVWLAIWAAVPTFVLGWEPILITSGSMGPVISAGDLVMIGDAPAGEVLAPGTVITFRSAADPDVLITHRIDGVRDDGLYRTRGDANGDPDSTPVRTEDIEGVGRMMVPLVGLPILWLQQDRTMFGLFLLATVAAIVAAGSTRGRADAVVRTHREFAGRDETDTDIDLDADAPAGEGP